MIKLTQDQIEALQIEIKEWMTHSWAGHKRSDREKWAIQDGIFILLDVLGYDDTGIQDALNEAL